MNILIAEDEAAQRAHMRECVQRYGTQGGLDVTIREFADGEALVSGYERGCDVLLADIDMPGMNGMDAAARIRQLDSRVMIVFCTNLVHRALDGYAVQALDFIVKPVGERRLWEALDKARRYLAAREPHVLSLHTQDGVLCVRAQDITYAETYGRKLLVHTAQGRLELRMTIAALEQALCRDGFFRIHNAYLVSLRYVQSVSGFEAVVAGDTLSVSRHKKKEFIERLTAFLGEQI